MSNDPTESPALSFTDLQLKEPLLKALEKRGYTTPTPIQAKMIPQVMAGNDVVGQAQTGTGKTAAFALPLLDQLTVEKKVRPQILVLTPTRELALQVAESFKEYGQFMKKLRVLPIYGGQEYGHQLKQLNRGVHVIVGTPGRIMDHIRRGSLNLSALKSLVLDEGDEMLNMGFLDDVEWILEQTPAKKQVALFSATMPKSIRKIASKYLTNPIEITIKNRTATASTISQHYLFTNGYKAKQESLERILEAESFDGILIFVRTKIQTVELSEHLSSRGYLCSPLNGDIPQSQRLRTVEHLKSKKIDILIATDVAARGLDVERISHVINFDVPFDTEAYIHRIGRTGRAGRNGKAILFLQSRERSMLKSIERTTRQKIQTMKLPSESEVQALRIEEYKKQITATLATDCTFYSKLIEDYCQETAIPVQQIAAALAKMSQGKTSRIHPKPKPAKLERKLRNPRNKQRNTAAPNKSRRKRPPLTLPEEGMDRYRIEVGSAHGVKPANIVGAIANEIDLGSEHIGRITIFDQHSTVDLPYGMPKPILRVLQKVHVLDRMMKIRRDSALTLSPENGIPHPLKQNKKKKKSGKSPRRKGQHKSSFTGEIATK